MQPINSGIRLFIVTIALFSCAFVHAQNDKLGSWEIANIMYKPNTHFSFYGEVQARSQRCFDDFFYHELKGGVMYTLPKKFSLMFAIGDYRTYTYPGNFKALQTKEFRMWEQLTFNSNIEPLRIEHRYRIEQRWLNGSYRNRFRYRLNPVLPINHKTISANTLYATLFDEVFFTNKAPYFERNRFFVGAGYQFSKYVALQTGFIRQYDYRKTDDGSGKNFLQTTLLFTVDKSKSHVPVHPQTLD